MSEKNKEISFECVDCGWQSFKKPSPYKCPDCGSLRLSRSVFKLPITRPEVKAVDNHKEQLRSAYNAGCADRDLDESNFEDWYLIHAKPLSAAQPFKAVDEGKSVKELHLGIIREANGGEQINKFYLPQVLTLMNLARQNSAQTSIPISKVVGEIEKRIDKLKGQSLHDQDFSIEELTDLLNIFKNNK